MSEEYHERRAADKLFLEMVNGLKRELEDHSNKQSTLIAELHRTVDACSSGAPPEIQRKRNAYLDLLIEREKSRASFRQAVIEKTIASLIWAMLVGLGYSVLHYLFPGRW